MTYIFSDDGTFSGYYDDGDNRVFILENLDCCLVQEVVVEAVKNRTPSYIAGFRVLRIFDEPVLRDIAATVYSESSHNPKESEGIARVIRNRAEYKGIDYSSPNFWRSHKEGGIGGHAIYGRDSARYREANNLPLKNWFDNKYMLSDLEATVRALFNPTDITKGAYFWEGNRSLKKPTNFFRKNLNKDPPVFIITKTFGGTTFLKYNPDHPKFGRNVWP
jgi:hypothetical protein